MPTATQSDILFTPSPQSISSSLLNHFLLLAQQRNPSLSLKTYQDLHSFSVQHRSAFWALVWEFCGIIHSSPYSSVVDESVPIECIPEWFSGSRLNFAENMLHYADTAPDACALMFEGEHFESDSAVMLPMQTMTYAELRRAVAKCAFALRTQSGVGVGDVVAAYAPNCIEVVVYMLAAASLGAVFTATSPDFGVSGVLERFQQTRPKVLLSCNAVYYNGKVHDHVEKVEQVAKGLCESLVTVIMIPYYTESFASTSASTFLRTLSREWTEYTSNNNNDLHYEQLPFNHPLYIMYSSGTTGKPKCLVHSAGGTLIQHKKEHMLHADLRSGEVIFQYTTIGWMMWQWLVSALSTGATVLLYDGSPLKPAPDRLFKIASKVGVSVFGTSAKFIQSLQEMSFKNEHSCPKLRMILSTGSPLSPSLFRYVYSNLRSDVILGSMSGGTDIISLFVGMNPMLPVRAGEIQCKCLGMAVECYNSDDNENEGRQEGEGEGKQEKSTNDSITDQSRNSTIDQSRNSTDRSITSGELICTKAFPSMPIYFWNDPDGSKYFNSYFATLPGVWFQGDYIQVANEKCGGGVVMLGRSDGTLNPGGVRFGSSEIYNVMMMQQFSARVEDTLVVGQRLPSPAALDERVLMFVKMRKGFVLDEELISEIKQAIRKELSPRHVPYSIRQCPDIPYTVNGKKVELAVKRIVCKMQSVHNVSSLANAESLKWFEREVFD